MGTARFGGPWQGLCTLHGPLLPRIVLDRMARAFLRCLHQGWQMLRAQHISTCWSAIGAGVAALALTVSTASPAHAFFFLVVPIPHASAKGSVPLQFTSDPPGVQITLTHGDVSNMATEICSTPCALPIPKGQAFRYEAKKEGYNVTVTPIVKWDYNQFSGYKLIPETIQVELAQVQQARIAEPPSPGKPPPPSARLPISLIKENANPDWLVHPTPEEMSFYYPELAKRQKIEGDVINRCVVLVDGSIDSCEVVSESPPNYGFGDAATKILMGYAQMSPKFVGGHPVVAQVNVPLAFRVGGGPNPH